MFALMVAAHGSFAAELVKSSELICGEQSNVAAISFFPGENQDDLLKKYAAALSGLDSQDGVLFLCDLFGGSPFNAASRLAAAEENWDVVSGVNLPMMLELYGARTGGSLQDVVAVAKQAGTQGVQALKSLQAVEEEEL